MKNLLYKEFKLAVHPLCYVMFAFAALTAVIPIYPAGTCFMFLLASYSILFLGANKGQQSNDLLYTALLPVRKGDIVKARALTVSVFTLVILAISAILIPVSFSAWNSMASTGEDMTMMGAGPQYFLVTMGFALFSLGLTNIIYFALYYRNGKSIVSSTLIGVFFFLILDGVLNIALPSFGVLNVIFESLVLQIIVFVIGLGGYLGLTFVAYKVGAKLLEKVDF